MALITDGCFHPSGMLTVAPTVVYEGKDGRRQKSFDALEWLAAMCSHVPNKGEQMVRYYGYYSNVSRGKRQKTGDDGAVAYILEPPMPDRAFRKNSCTSMFRRGLERAVDQAPYLPKA